jgi:hypothetical protein
MPGHWQTLLQERLPGSLCVPRLGKEILSLAAWVEALDRTIRAAHAPVVLVAHSAGVMMAVQWARTRSGPVRAALLAAPPDFESGLPPGYPSTDALARGGWLPIPRARLPFPSLVAVSSNDPLASAGSARHFARAWGAEAVDAGPVGHLNPASGFGEWPQADELLERLGVEAAAHQST